MAIVYATKTGNWSDTTVWNTGALPTSSDDVYSNTFTVTINTSPTVLSVSNAATTGVTVGGTFVLSNGVTLTCTGTGIANSGVGNVYVVSSSLTIGQSATIVANCTGASLNNALTVGNTATGTLNIVGTLTGGSGNGSHCVQNTSTGVVNITGNCTSGLTGSTVYCIVNSSGGTINITGNCSGAQSGGGGTASHCLINGTSSNAIITGNCIGGVTNSAAVFNSSTGSVLVTGTIQAGAGASAVWASANSGTTILSGPFLTTANGIIPVYAQRWFWPNSNVTPTYYQIRTANLLSIRPLYTADSVGGNPATSNVRSGTVYGPAGELTGTCAVPGASSVLSGVPIDNTTGTATIDAASIRSALGLASANLDTQLAPLTNLDATVSSRLAASAYSAAPSAATNASAVRTELSTELGRIDVATSTRLAPSGTLARVTLTDTTTALTNSPDVPTEAEIASQVRTELTPELSRIANCATVATTGQQIQDALS